MQVKRKQLTGYVIACYENNRLPSLPTLQAFVVLSKPLYHDVEPTLAVDTEDLTDLWRYVERYLVQHNDVISSPNSLVTCAVSEFMASRGLRNE